MSHVSNPGAGRIDALRRPLRQLVEEVCLRLSRTSVPLRAWTRLTRTDTAVEGKPEMRPDLRSFVLFDGLAAEASPALDRIVATVNADPIWLTDIMVDRDGHHLPEGRRRWFVFVVLTMPFLDSYFHEVGAGRFDEKVFSATFERLRTDLSDPATVRAVRSTPLVNVKLAVDTLRLERDVRLRQTSNDEIERWVNDMIQPAESSKHAQCAVEVIFGHARRDQSAAVAERQKADETTRQVVTLLRLLTERRVVPLFTEESIDGILFNPIMRPKTEPVLQPPLEEAGILDSRAGERLRHLWDRLRKGPNAGRLSLAFRRFSGAADRSTDEDSLIDYWVGLESLFTPDSTQELRFRASLRIGAMLGTTPSERVRLYGAMRKSYRIRSRIVHGNGYTFTELADASREAKCALRTTLLKLLEAENSFDARQIDEAILRDGTAGNMPSSTS